MPLDPKQQPPYYTPGTTPTPGAGALTRLNTQFTDIQTSGTTETDLYTYTLPANTLTQNGDTLEINYSEIQNTVDTHITRFYWNGLAQLSISDGTNANQKWTIQIIRTTTNTARIIMQIWSGNESGTAHYQTDTPINYTNTIIIKFSGQCPTTGFIQTYSMTIDKITV